MSPIGLCGRPEPPPGCRHPLASARAASTTLHRLANDILKECRADPAKDAPLVRALIAATDPLTQKRLSDKDIADELIFFLFAAHDNHGYDSHICNVAAGAPSGDSASRRHGGRSVPRRGTDARRCFAAAVHGAGAEGGVAVVPSGPHWNTNGNPRCRDRGDPVEAGTNARVRYGWPCSGTRRCGKSR
jgi:hypothetical protein